MLKHIRNKSILRVLLLTILFLPHAFIADDAASIATAANDLGELNKAEHHNYIHKDIVEVISSDINKSIGTMSHKSLGVPYQEIDSYKLLTEGYMTEYNRHSKRTLSSSGTVTPLSALQPLTNTSRTNQNARATSPTVTISGINKTIAGKSDTIIVNGTISNPDGTSVTLTATLGSATKSVIVASGNGSYSIPFPAQEVGEGTYTNIRVNARNPSLSSYKDYTFGTSLKVDLTDPFFWSSRISPNEPTSGNIILTLDVSDVFTGVKRIILPDNRIVTGTTNAVYTATKNGDYVFTVEDNAGNSTSYIMKITNQDKTVPVASLVNLIQSQNGTYKVTVEASDASGIASVKLNDNTLLSYDVSNNHYSSNALTSKPTSFNMTDGAGTNSGAIAFVSLPTVTFPSGYSPTIKVKEDLLLNLKGTHILSYKLGARNYNCSSSTCELTLTKPETVSATNTNGMSSSTLLFDVKNIDRTTANLLLEGKKNPTDETKINLTWNLALTSPVINCSDGKTSTPYNVTGKSYVLTAQNKMYSCTLKGTYDGSNLTSNVATVYPNYNKELVSNLTKANFPKHTIDKNIYKETTRIGTTYYINLNRNNEPLKSISIPNALKR